MKAPMCRLCNTNHWSGEPHKWPDTDTAHIRDAKEIKSDKPSVATLKKKVATITGKKPEISKDVATIRQVSIRELNHGISKQFSNLPFKVTKNGKVIAVVREK